MKIDIAQIFQEAAVRTLRGRDPLPEGLALLLQARVSYCASGAKKKAETDAHIHFILSGRGSIRVHFAQGADICWPEDTDAMNALDWEQTAQHDSAWRFDGIDTPLKNLDRSIREALAKKAKITPRDVSSYVSGDPATIYGVSVPVDYTGAESETHRSRPVFRPGEVIRL